MPLSLKIDVTKLNKDWFFHGKNGAKYAEVVVIENRNGEDQYGNTHMAVQNPPKEERDQGTKGPIIGNGKVFGQQQQRGSGGNQGGYRKPAQQQRPAPPDDESEEIPW